LPLYRVAYLLLPMYADANAVPNITTVHTVIKWLWQKLYQACEINPKATELLTSSPVYDPHAAWVALHRHFLPQDPITTMSRESRLSTLRQRPSETNSDFLNRFFEDLLIIEYTGFPLEERRVSHFIINALSDPNHRQNASIQYQHLKQSSTHSFDYWLNVLRSLPPSHPTLPIGLQHVNLKATYRVQLPTPPLPPPARHRLIIMFRTMRLPIQLLAPTVAVTVIYQQTATTILPATPIITTTALNEMIFLL